MILSSEFSESHRTELNSSFLSALDVRDCMCDGP